MIELDILRSNHQIRVSYIYTYYTYVPSTQSTITKTYCGSSVVNAYSNKCNSPGLLP